MSLLNNKFFLKSFLCFFAVVFVFSVVLTAAKVTDFENRKKATVENLNIDFVNDAENMGQMFYQLRAALHEVSVGISSDASFGDNSYVRKNNVRNSMRSILVDRHQNEFSGFLSAVFVVDERNPQMIYEYAGTYSDEEFFSRYSGTDYPGDFWYEKSKSSSVFEILKASRFSVVEETMQRAGKDLLPVVFKSRADSTYAIIALIDVEKMAETFGMSCIFAADGSLLYAGKNVTEHIISKASAIGESGKFEVGESDYIFVTADSGNENIRIAKYVPGEELDKIGEISLLRELTVPVVAVFCMLVLAFIVSHRYAKKMKGIMSVVSGSLGAIKNMEVEITSLDEISEGVKEIASHNILPSNEAKSKDSVLDSVFLQSKMRDVYVGIDDIEKSVDISRSFFMIYVRVNYKEEFEDYIGSDLGKATFLLKQLIEMYLETWGIYGTTFQIEKNGIVSVFDIQDGFSGEREIVDNLVNKLSNESEYAFFTIAVSHIYDGMENVKSVYDALIDLSKYSKPVAETQVLYEGEVQFSASRFCFSVEEMGKLSAILQNGNEAEIKRKVDEILDYNIKKEINCFELYLLSTEIINCAVKLINRKLHTIPQNIKLSEVYKDLERANTPAEYKKICNGFLCEVMSVVKENKREDDYIISYILEYIDNHYAEDIYLNLFAEKLKLTGAYISSYFKEKMNVNLSDYVNNYRIKKAVELSENPQNKNKDIAVMVGLPNINTFIRLFKKYTGYTPGEYRKKHYGDDYKK